MTDSVSFLDVAGYIFGVLALAFAFFAQRGRSIRAGNTPPTAADLLPMLAEYTRATHSDDPQLVARIGTLETSVAQLRREFNDLDEATERRFRRMSARARRADGDTEPPDADAPPIVPTDQRQLLLDMAHAAPAAAAGPAPTAPTPRLVRIGPRR